MLNTMNRGVMHSVVLIVGALLTLLVLALPVAAVAADDFLAPEAAFRVSSRMVDANTVELSYAIADGYYLYRERFDFKAMGAELGVPVIPPGKHKFDETFQKDVEIYRQNVTIRIPVKASAPFILTATSQGCADQGLCYPPMTSDIRFSVNEAGNGGAPVLPETHAPDAENGKLAALLQEGKLLAIAPLFILLGLGLAFTPCVLPMLPILSAIIVGEGQQVSRRRGLFLSALYALGMAIVYTALGVAAGLAGEGLSAALQSASVLTLFALLMVVLSLSMFGMYELQMPTFIQTKLGQLSGQWASGKFIGVFAMAALSALIVGPCVAAPLAGTLVFISHTRNVIVGGTALFSMAFGMSLPLLVVGASAGAILPRAGAWMDVVKRTFGVLMLATALWMVSPVIPVRLQMLGWAAIGIGYAIYLLSPGKRSWMSRTSALVFGGLGFVQLTGASTGGQDVLAPLAHWESRTTDHAVFKKIASVEELDVLLQKAHGKTVMLDFYADWCVSCKEMERFTFNDTRIRSQFSDMVLLQADVTANSQDDKSLLKRFGLFGPPGIIFFDRNGHEIANAHVIGYQNADKFLRSLSFASSR
ncbi:MAG TPA: protein-disulfide reductase DsbD [Burkholderiaceae bacterium]|nr:protein-disulfide reductase DsbD [Burkholderiaceae bacterium]